MTPVNVADSASKKKHRSEARKQEGFVFALLLDVASRLL
jgi:hypothetical protein